MERYNPFFKKEAPADEERELADNIAHWALLQFISGDVQTIKRSFFITDRFTEIRISDLIDGQATLLRICGEGIGESEKYDWAVIVKIGGNNYIYQINTPGNMGTLQPRVQEYSLSEIQTLSHEEIIENLEIAEFKELMSIDQDPNKIDIVFSGTQESDRPAVRRMTSKPARKPVFEPTPAYT